ncbi:MAG: cytochrome b [Gammaproteobacteria bacterium]
MALRNTNDNFGSLTKLLHWAIAGFFIVSYCSAYYAIWFTVDGMVANDIAVQIHITSGILVSFFILLRVYWRLTNSLPTPPPGAPREHLAARLSHRTLYVFMVVMPLTGYLGTYRDADYLGVTNFGDTRLFAWVAATIDTTWEEWEVAFDYVHRTVLGSKLLWILLVIHIGAALFHHFHRRDGTLRRMLPGRR